MTPPVDDQAAEPWAVRRFPPRRQRRRAGPGLVDNNPAWYLRGAPGPRKEASRFAPGSRSRRARTPAPQPRLLPVQEPAGQGHLRREGEAPRLPGALVLPGRTLA